MTVEHFSIHNLHSGVLYIKTPNSYALTFSATTYLSGPIILSTDDQPILWSFVLSWDDKLSDDDVIFRSGTLTEEQKNKLRVNVLLRSRKYESKLLDQFMIQNGK